MMMVRLLIQLPALLKARLDRLRAQGYTTAASSGMCLSNISDRPLRWGGRDGER